MLKFVPLLFLVAATALPSERTNAPISTTDVEHAEKIIGLEFTPAKRELMLQGLQSQLRGFETARKTPLSNSVPPALQSNPLPVGFTLPPRKVSFDWKPPKKVKRPENLDDLAFYSVAQLSALIRSRQVTSLELTEFFLARLKKYGPKLECIITLTEDLALQQARAADAELKRGKYRGPLHGIPYAAKDLLATKGIKTTWGSVPFKDQVLDYDATVVTRLREAGAVLVAKTTLGELAWGEVWFGGKTRNPWNLEEGSSGSSAGSAAGTSAGLFPFAIGSETWGSIISPSTICGITGLRPTYGRVSRHGAMALSWSMDKIGPICRTAEDAALILHAIEGPDDLDPFVIPASFTYKPRTSLKGLRIGYLDDLSKRPEPNRKADDAMMQTLRELGAELVPLKLPTYSGSHLSIILDSEAAAAFDDLTRDGRDDLLVRQVRVAWPNAFREARLIPAVEYIQAQRIRHLLIQDMADLLKSVDVYIAPAFEGENSLLTNLTGHPALLLPNGKSPKDGRPLSVTLIGQLFGEGELLSIAALYQQNTSWHKIHPSLPE